MILLRSQSISYFNVKRTIWLKAALNSNFLNLTKNREKFCL